MLLLRVLVSCALKSWLSSSQEAGGKKPAQKLEQAEMVGLLDGADGFGFWQAVRKELERACWDNPMALVAVGEGVRFPQTVLQRTCYQMSTDKGGCFVFPWAGCTKAVEVWRVLHTRLTGTGSRSKSWCYTLGDWRALSGHLKSQKLSDLQVATSPVGMLRAGHLQARWHTAAFDAVEPLLRIYISKRPSEKKSLWHVFQNRKQLFPFFYNNFLFFFFIFLLAFLHDVENQNYGSFT